MKTTYILYPYNLTLFDINTCMISIYAISTSLNSLSKPSIVVPVLGMQHHQNRTPVFFLGLDV